MYTKTHQIPQLLLPNEGLAMIFSHEVLGQLSDGMWEDTSPVGHYKFWAGLEVGVSDNGEFCYRPAGHLRPSHNHYDLPRLCRQACDLSPRMRASYVGTVLHLSPTTAEKHQADATQGAVTPREASDFSRLYALYTRNNCLADLRGLKTFMGAIADGRGLPLTFPTTGQGAIPVFPYPTLQWLVAGKEPPLPPSPAPSGGFTLDL